MSPFRRLWLAQTVSLLGDFVAVFAVQMALTFRMHGSPREISGVFIAGLVPGAILGPFAGALADRWDPRRTMITSDLSRAVLILLLAFAINTPQIWAVSFAIGCVSSFFSPAFAITVPLLIGQAELPAAYARLQQSMQIVRISSPAVAAAIVGWLGERACYYADSASFLFSAGLLATLRYSSPATPAAAVHLRAGIRFLISDKKFSSLVLALAAATFAGSCFGSLASLYVRDILHRGPTLLALISTLIGAGTVAGAAVVRRAFTHFRDPLTLVCDGMATVGASLLAFARLRNELPALAASVIMGAGVGAVMVAATAILQGRTPPELRGRVSGTSAALTSFAQLAGMLIAGGLASRIGIPGVLTISSLILFVTAFTCGNLNVVSTATQGILISTPKCEPGIGKIIRAPESPDLIDGVQVRPYDLWPDDRGYFLEVARMRQGLAADFPPETTQVSAALNYPGIIKAFHFHKHQTDLWVPAQGMFQVVLVDLRPGSRTFGLKNTLYTGALKPWQIFIPPGVGHGYKIIGESPAMLIYVTNCLYNPQDEGRIPYNDASIAYDWELQHK